MKKLTVIIEGSEHEGFSCYTLEDTARGLHGYGDTVEECKEDFMVCIDEDNADHATPVRYDIEWRMAS